MSKVTTIYDQIINTTLPAIYVTDYTRIINPYDLEDNPEHLLRQGYGLKVGSQSPLELEFKSKYVQQSYSIVLTREVLKLEADITDTDTQVKALMEDVNTGQLEFYNNNQIGIEASIEDIELGPVSAVEYFTGNTNFVSMEYEIILTIREDL